VSFVGYSTKGPGVFCWLFSWLADFTNKTWPQKLREILTMEKF
jgi:hypothetical protein